MASDSNSVSTLSKSAAKSEALRSKLTSWRASAAQELIVEEEERMFGLTRPIDLSCIHILCKEDMSYVAGYEESPCV
jgi:hypothetical protein